jgi:hypothetical protein
VGVRAGSSILLRAAIEHRIRYYMTICFASPSLIYVLAVHCIYDQSAKREGTA